MNNNFSNAGSVNYLNQASAFFVGIASTGSHEKLEDYYVKDNSRVDFERYTRAQNGGLCVIHLANGAADWSNIDPLAQAGTPNPAIPDVSDTIDIMVKRLKLKVGLSTTDVAKVYGITRQQVHSYLKDSTAAQNASAKNADRAQLIDKLVVNYAVSLPRSPASLAKTLRVNGASLLDALSRVDVKDAEVKAIFEAVSKAMLRSDKTPSSPYANKVLDELVPQVF